MVAKMPVVQNSIGKLQEALPVVIVGSDGNEPSNAAAGATVGTVNADGSVTLVNGGGVGTLAQGLVGAATKLALTLSAVAGGGSISVQARNDGANWQSLRGQVTSGSTGGALVSAVGVEFDIGAWREWRIQQTAWTSGTTVGAVSIGPGTTIHEVALNAGNNNVGAVRVIADGTTSAQLSATLHKLIAAATTNATSVKASAGRLVGGAIANTSAAFKYFKFFNKASAPVVGTDTPVLTLALPPSSSLSMVDLVNVFGLYFATGLAYAITGAAADADATAVAAGDVVVNLLYA